LARLASDHLPLKALLNLAGAAQPLTQPAMISHVT
jgi:hypothetical protein